MNLFFSSLLVLTTVFSTSVFANDYIEKFPGGIRITDGDTPVLIKPHRTKATELIVNVLDDGEFDRWNNKSKMNLTYCISDDFADKKEMVVQAMDVAVKDWMASASVQYLYLPQHDQNCDQFNENIVFDIRPIDEGEYLARAFFPNFPRISRNILIDLSSFRYAQRTLVGIMRHELGHTLGFRHEHIHPDNKVDCSEDEQFMPLTEYDRKSVMHYPQCGGSNDIIELVITDFDREGARKIYP